ncbi:hypothetical protein FA13DRAFT_1800669 [Coprinellus micaceus]|uniref:Uncharacterized protein n=1 Tax=Coprinellus micaceus TaxID=71717 RepID=A0A4Y7SFW5_COPMI|nr:hypothetical protein FA13DRAFT_1800669 [Coprinellus micaceus]
MSATTAWESFREYLREPELPANSRTTLKYGTVEFNKCEMAVRAYHGALYNFLTEFYFSGRGHDQLIDRVKAKLKTRDLEQGLEVLLRQYLMYEEEMRWFDSRSMANDIFAQMLNI